MAYLSLFSQLGNLSFVMPQMVVNSALLSFQPLIITYSMRPFFIRLRVLRGRSHRFGVKRGWRGRRRILPHQCRMLLIQRHSLGVGSTHAHDLMGRLDPHWTPLLEGHLLGLPLTLRTLLTRYHLTLLLLYHHRPLNHTPWKCTRRWTLGSDLL